MTVTEMTVTEGAGISDNALLEVWALERGATTWRFGQEDFTLSWGARPIGAWHGTSSSATGRSAMLLSRYPRRLHDALDAAGDDPGLATGAEPQLEVLFAGERVIASRGARGGQGLLVPSSRIEAAVEELRRTVPGLPHGAVGLAVNADGTVQVASLEPAPDLRGFSDGQDGHRRLCSEVAYASFPELGSREPSTGILRVQLRPYGAASVVAARVQRFCDRLGVAVETHRVGAQVQLDVEADSILQTDLLVRLVANLQHRCGPVRTHLNAPVPAVAEAT